MQHLKKFNKSESTDPIKDLHDKIFGQPDNTTSSFKDRRRKEIEAEIVRKQKELDELQNSENDAVIELSDYTTEDKVKFFDSMYKMAAEHLKSAEEDGRVDDDSEHWFFEEGFTILNLKDKKKLWNFYNKLV